MHPVAERLVEEHPLLGPSWNVRRQLRQVRTRRRADVRRWPYWGETRLPHGVSDRVGTPAM
jgi:hypothetical protein